MLTSLGLPDLAAPAHPPAQTIKGSALRDMLALVMRPNLLSLALGLPALELMPLAECRIAAAQLLTDPKALQYQLPSESLKRHVRRLLASRGVNCEEEQIFLTSGAQQATHLLANLLLQQRQQQVLIEEVTYEGLHLAIQPLQPRILTVPSMPGTGVDIDAIETQLLRDARPAFIYAITDGHNPLGVSLSREARSRLVELARRFHIPIVEDDVFGLLNYDGPSLPPMRSLDEEWVFYIGSFSKILGPSLRVGWIVAPHARMPALSVLKHASDLDVTTLGHLTASAYLDAGHLPGHLASIRREYGFRRDAMLSALELHFPSEARWTKPSSGMFIWVELPPGVDTVGLLRVAVESEQVAFMPSAIFAAPGCPCSRNGMRLNFTSCPPSQIEDGVARLGKVLRNALRSN